MSIAFIRLQFGCGHSSPPVYRYARLTLWLALGKAVVQTQLQYFPLPSGFMRIE
jgi:hypothetical protein